ncbi:MAG TPA: hypothetical protein VIG74_04370 [Alphaproteobacteria bacterium]
MVLSDFSGVPAGTKGVITENYGRGVMVTWAKERTLDEISARLEAGQPMYAAQGYQADGFGDDELEYLAFETKTHPWKGENERQPRELLQEQWLIWSNEHGGWWAPRRNGYVTLREEAGRYSFKDALQIVQSANYPRPEKTPNEAMVLDVDYEALKAES